MKRGDVYWVRLDPIEDSEQAGTRPVVIVSRDAINHYSPVVVICPFTDASHVTRRYPIDVQVAAPEGGLSKDSVVLTGQVRAVGKHRFGGYMGTLGAETMRAIDQALKITLDLG